jgi:hypothetical protein
LTFAVYGRIFLYIYIFSHRGKPFMKQLKSRQERFCRKFVELGTPTMAARAAGYAPASASNAGYRLIRHPRIARRVAEIEAETGDVHCDTREVLLGKLETVFRRAIVDHQFATAARAVDLQARLRGFIGPAAVAANDATGRPRDAWDGAPPANGGRRRGPVFGDIARLHRGEPVFDEF